MRGLVAVAVLTVVALVAVACGDDDGDAAGNGWLGGEPEWTAGYEGGAVADAAGSGGADDAPSTLGEERDDIAPGEPYPGPDTSPLRAGSVDDNADFERFIAYLDRIAGLGIPLRELDPRGRIVIEVTGADGLPVAGAEVVVNVDGGEIARLRTTADGTARFHPAFYGRAGVESFTLAAVGQEITVAPGASVQLTAGEDGGAPDPLAVDILFLLDATGSMGDEIDRLKASIDSVAARIAAFEPSPDLRVAMTLYRDEGDAFVTATFDFTADVDAFRAELAKVVAEGGGDFPEAVDEGLAEALSAPAWRDPATTLQFVFLVADAPPQIGRQVEVGYPDSVRDAVSRGVKLFPIASSDSDDQAEAVFRQLAQATGARFVFLSYGAGGAATGGSTDIASTDYEELALDDLVVRLVGEDLAALTGREFVAPQVGGTTTTTRPQGQ
jgi:hypothetical protein